MSTNDCVILLDLKRVEKSKVWQTLLLVIVLYCIHIVPLPPAGTKNLNKHQVTDKYYVYEICYCLDGTSNDYG